MQYLANTILYSNGAGRKSVFSGTFAPMNNGNLMFYKASVNNVNCLINSFTLDVRRVKFVDAEFIEIAPFAFTNYTITSESSIGSSDWGGSGGSSGTVGVGGGTVDTSNFVVKTGAVTQNIEGSVTVEGAVVAGATNGIAPDDLPVATSSLFGVIKFDAATLGLNGSGQLTVIGGGWSNVAWGVPTSQYSPLTINSVTRNLSVDGHTHSYFLDLDLKNIQGGDSNHRLELGYTARDYVNWYEYGGLWKFIQRQGAIETELLQINTVNILYKGNSIWHAGNFNPSNYLPLSGGTLSGNLWVGGVGLDAAILVRNISSYESGTLGLNPWGGNVTINGNTAWHAGNDGAGSGLDADLLDGRQCIGFTNNYSDLETLNLNFDTIDFGGINSSFVARCESGVLNPPIPYVYNWSLWQQGNKFRGSQIAIHAYALGTGMYVRSSSYDNNAWNNWRKVAFEDSNVASATKLANTRTIWGQSFNGEGNVTGALSGATTGTFSSLLSCVNLIVTNSGTNRAVITQTSIGDAPTDFKIGTNNADRWSITCRDSSLNYGLGIYNYGRLNFDMFIFGNTGNIGINTTTDYGYKLDVNGTLRTIGAAYLNSTLAVTGASTFTGLLTANGGINAANVVSSGAVVAGALNGTLPDDLPVATSSLFGVVKSGASINNNAGVININGRHYTTTSTYTDAAVREITAELALGTGSMANGTLDQIQLSFAPITTTRGLTANVIATNTGEGMGLKLSFRKDTGTGRWYIMIYNDSGAAVTRDGILLSIRGQQTI